MKSPLPKLAKDLAALVGIARKETDPEKIDAALTDARGQVETAVAEREAAEAAYRDGLLDATPAESERQLAEASAAKVRVDRAEALVAALAQRLALARDDREQQRRRTRYEAAQARAEAAKQALLQDYPDLARRAHALLRILAEAEIDVAAVNAELPAGADAILSPESAVRDAARLPLDMTPIEVELWRAVGNLEPLSDANQQRVKPDRMNPDHGTIDIQGRAIPCVRVLYRRDVVLYDDRAGTLPPLAAALNLPALYADTPEFWLQEKGGREPAETLAQVALLEPASGPSWHKPAATLAPHRFAYWPVSTPPDPDHPHGSLALEAA